MTMRNAPIKIARGQDGTFEVLIYAAWDQKNNISVRASQPALAAATQVAISRLNYPLSNGDMLDFNGMVVVVNGAHSVGVNVLNVNAIAGPVQVGDVGTKLQDLTTFALVCYILEPEAATPTYTLTPTLGDQTQVTGRGRAQFTVSATQSAAALAQRYFANAWRTNVGSARPEWTGDMEFFDA